MKAGFLQLKKLLHNLSKESNQGLLRTSPHMDYKIINRCSARIKTNEMNHCNTYLKGGFTSYLEHHPTETNFGIINNVFSSKHNCVNDTTE